MGDLRWREPQPVKPWQGERSADPVRPALHAERRGSAIDPLNPRMSEDCLYLERLDTSEHAANDKLPVTGFRIYGGDFNVGAGSGPWYNGARTSPRTA